MKRVTRDSDRTDAVRGEMTQMGSLDFDADIVETGALVKPSWRALLLLGLALALSTPGSALGGA